MSINNRGNTKITKKIKGQKSLVSVGIDCVDCWESLRSRALVHQSAIVVAVVVVVCCQCTKVIDGCLEIHHGNCVDRKAS